MSYEMHLRVLSGGVDKPSSEFLARGWPLWLEKMHASIGCPCPDRKLHLGATAPATASEIARFRVSRRVPVVRGIPLVPSARTSTAELPDHTTCHARFTWRRTRAREPQHLAIDSYDKAVAVITRFYPRERFPQKTLYALGELLPKRG
jgi:hypothetical protein